MSEEINLNKYKLSCELFGHSADVRAVQEGNDCILSGSRDNTVKVWKKLGNEYKEIETYKHHTNFISSILYLEEDNWICTGSNDSTICIYRNNERVPFVVLNGHISTVCALANGLRPKTIISGSWDKTARIWTIDESGSSTFIKLKGHEAAVWAVTSLSSNKYVTGSADKSIMYWNEKGEKLRILKEHQDCVRGLIGMDDGSLISCSNDAVIKYWNEEGECIREFHGHTNYIYTIAKNKKFGNDIFISGSEDNTFRMWSLSCGILGDPIYLPANSVWSVTCLKNGDIVTGSSDGVVRIFTMDPSRFACEEVLKSFYLATEAQKLQANEELGGIKHKDLPGPESLLTEGQTEGQTKIVRHANGKIQCYQWEKNEWKLIGDVMGGSGGTQASSGKTLYEGKEYDYVFNVDLSDTEPAIKLPYNKGEDPWLTAQNFIYKHNLPQAYLDRIANFIVKNSDTPTIGQTNTAFHDPFTGGSRYIPGTNTNTSTVNENVDPFTGGSAYTTMSNSKEVITMKHFPFNKYITFDNCDPTKIFDKLKEFNKTATLNNQGLNDELLISVSKLSQREINADKTSVETLQLLLTWPEEILFPILDIARLAVRNEGVCSHLLNTNFLDIIIEKLLSLPANQLMSIRCLANMLRHLQARNQLKARLHEIIDKTTNIKQGSQNLQIALATLYLNLTITQTEIASEGECHLILNGIIDFWKWCTDLEAYYRCMQGLGNIICTPYSDLGKVQVISVDYMNDKLHEFSTSQMTQNFEKLTECAKDLLDVFLSE